MRRTTAGLASAFLALGLGACDAPSTDGARQTAEVTESSPANPAVTSDDPAAKTAPDVAAVSVEEVITDESLLDQVQWVLEHLKPGASGPSLESLGQRLAPSFLDAVPAWQLGPVFAQLRGAGPYQVTRAVQSQDGLPGATLWLHAEDPLIMSIRLDADAKIETLLFQPDTSGEAPELTSLAQLDEVLADEVPGVIQVVAAEVSDGVCSITHSTAGLPEGGDPAPTGSVFKLLVLTALVDAVADGQVAWDDRLTITEEVKSLPSGTLQDRDSGEEVTVGEAAELMISISDNTATDLLIGLLGQDRLADTARGLGVPEEARVLPVLTTRQLFQLGWQVGDEVRDAWAAASDQGERAAILADLPDGLDVDPASVTTPVWVHGVDWFLTGQDVCRVHARLQQQAATEAGGPIRDILAANPGLTPAAAATYQGYKGGSAPGVLAFSFYVEAGEQGAGQVLSVQIRSEGDVDLLRAATIVEAALPLITGSGG